MVVLLFMVCLIFRELQEVCFAGVVSKSWYCDQRCHTTLIVICCEWFKFVCKHVSEMSTARRTCFRVCWISVCMFLSLVTRTTCISEPSPVPWGSATSRTAPTWCARSWLTPRKRCRTTTTSCCRWRKPCSMSSSTVRAKRVLRVCGWGFVCLHVLCWQN